jgi:hypothetical protein
VIYYEFAGGLGDIFMDCYTHDNYTAMDATAPDKRVGVVFRCENPFAHEIASKHPKAAQFDIHNLGPISELSDEYRRKHSLDELAPRSGRSGVPVTFHPTAEDQAVLSSLPKKFILLSPSTGQSAIKKNIPLHAAVEAATIAGLEGFPVVSIGRTYVHPVSGLREELKLPDGLCIDLTDKLSVHGTHRLVAMATACIVSYSSVMLLSWLLGKPTFTTYPDWCQHEWDEEWYCTFGKNNEGCVNRKFEDLSAEELRKFFRHRAVKP